MSHRMLEKDRPGKLFVGGLAEDIDEKTLEREFTKFGRITEAMVIRDKVRQVSRGFGFVTYENPIDAEEAVKHMDAKEIHGKKLHVEDAVRGGIMNQESSRFGRDGGFRDGGFRGRPSRGGPRGRGGPPSRGGRGGFPPRDGPPRGSGYGGRGGSFSRGGRGGGMLSRFESRSSPPSMRRDDSPPRSSLMSRPPGRGRNGYDSGRGRSMSGFDSRREDRYDSSYSDRGPPPRSRDMYASSPPRDSGRGGALLDSRMGPSRTSRDYPPSSRDYPPSSRDYPPSRDYQGQRDYSPERGGDRYSYRDGYGQSRSDDRGDSYSRGASSRGDYMAPRSEMRDSPRDSYGTRGGDGYSSMSSRDYREPLSSRGGDRFERDYDGGSSSVRFSREIDSRGPPRSDGYMSRDSGPPSRNYSSSSGSRGPPPFSSSRTPYPGGSSNRRSSGDRDGFNPGSRRPSGPPPSRGGPPPAKRPRSDGPPSRGPPPPSFRR